MAFIPFPTALIGAYIHPPVAVVPYGATLILSGLAPSLLWSYATRNHRLVAPQLSPEMLRAIHRRILRGPLLYVVAIVFSTFSAKVTLLFYALIPITYSLPEPIDSHLRRIPRG